MALQTSNILLIIRCFTKYIIEIENENALMEQLNTKNSTISNSESTNNKNDQSSSSSNGSPLRHKTQSRENSLNENESDPDLVQTNFVNEKNEDSNNENDILHELVKNIFELCIDIPVE
jgi:hypothetical protein